MAVIWGLDLKEIQWGKFKSSYMFNTVYHLRRTKMIVYQIAMIFCVVSESLGTAALSDYVDQEDNIIKGTPEALEYNNDFVGIMSYNIFVGVSIATIWGAAFFFELVFRYLFPIEPLKAPVSALPTGHPMLGMTERHESKSVRLAWKICAVLVCIMGLADVLAMTVIVATHAAYVTGVDQATAERVLAQYPKPTLVYRKNPYAVASVVSLWIGLPATIASTVILFKSHAHDDKFGPKASHVRDKEAVDTDVEKAPANTNLPSDGTDNPHSGSTTGDAIPLTQRHEVP